MQIIIKNERIKTQIFEKIPQRNIELIWDISKNNGFSISDISSDPDRIIFSLDDTNTKEIQYRIPFKNKSSIIGYIEGYIRFNHHLTTQTLLNFFSRYKTMDLSYKIICYINFALIVDDRIILFAEVNELNGLKDLDIPQQIYYKKHNDKCSEFYLVQELENGFEHHYDVNDLI